MSGNCIMCKIVQGAIPARKILETETTLAFLDIHPLSKGHALVIPKVHAPRLHQLPDAALADLLPVAKRLATALGVADYNVLQNNGALAHQEVEHVHFHIIPKTSEADGLGIHWPAKPASKEELDQSLADILARLPMA